MQDEISLVDETLNIHAKENYHLSIQVSPDGFSFTILNDINNKYILLKHFPVDPNLPKVVAYEKIEEFLNKEELLNQAPYKSVRCIYQSKKSLNIPADYFTEQDIRTYYESVFELEQLEELHYNSLSEPDMIAVFSIPNQLSNLLVKKFNNIQFFHHTAPLMQRVHNEYTEGEEVMALFIAPWFFNMMVIKNNQLLVENVYDYKDAMDIIYFCMNAVNQYELNPVQMKLLMQGDIKIPGNVTSTFEKYIKHIDFIKRPSTHLYSYTFYRLPNYQFANLLSLPDFK